MSSHQRSPDEFETRGAVSLTIAWMLTCLSTAVAVLLVISLHLLVLAFPAQTESTHPLAKIAGVFLFVALLTGLLCLIFTPLTLFARRRSPPRSITTGAVLIGLSPLIVYAVLAVFHKH